MKKADLVEVARRELNMSLAAAEQETVITLRELIRRNRDIQKASDNPLAKLPKGLSGMKKEELIEEMEKRGLPTTSNSTRPAMILAIRDYVTARTTLAQQDQTPSTSSTQENGQMQTDEFEMIPSPRRRGRAE